MCPASSSDYAAFRRTLVSALSVLAKGAPNARVFLVSQFGSPATYVSALTLEQRMRIGGGSGPCDFVAASGRVLPERVANLERIILGYEAQLAAACKRFARCRYDGGAFGRIIDRAEYWSGDLNHFSVKGHAKAAKVAWDAMTRAGVVPRG